MSKDEKNPVVEKMAEKFREIYPDKSKLKVLVDKNPMREGTPAYERFEIYFKAKTVGAAIKKGALYGELAKAILDKQVEVEVVK